jgi:hypothetical protein
MKYKRIGIGSFITDRMSGDGPVIVAEFGNGVDNVTYNVSETGPEYKKDVVVQTPVEPSAFTHPGPSKDKVAPGNAAKSRRNLLSKAGKASKTLTESLRENVKKTAQPTPDRSANMMVIRGGHSTVYKAYGGDLVAAWKRDNSMNPLMSAQIGYDCNLSKLVQTAFGDSIYPSCGVVVGRALLPLDGGHLPFWKGQFYDRWDNLQTHISEKLETDPSAEGYERMCYQKLNIEVKKYAASSMRTIYAIKRLTPTELLTDEDAEPGTITPAMLKRLNHMMGWAEQLEKIVRKALRDFFVWLSDMSILSQNVPSTTNNRLLAAIKAADPTCKVESPTPESENEDVDSDEPPVSEDEEEEDVPDEEEAEA